MIIPAILVNNFSDFEEQAKKLSFAPLIQIDVMDGSFVDNISFTEIEKINGLNLTTGWELHLMVQHPLEEITKWANVKNIKRAIFHIEGEDNPLSTINAIKQNGWEAGIALNPDTSERELLPYISSLDIALFMTVYPGQQGAPFVPEVQEKIVNFRKTLESKETELTIAVDGAVNKNNILEIKNWGVNNFCVGGAISRATDPKAAYEELTNLTDYV